MTSKYGDRQSPVRARNVPCVLLMSGAASHHFAPRHGLRGEVRGWKCCVTTAPTVFGHAGRTMETHITCCRLPFLAPSIAAYGLG